MKSVVSINSSPACIDLHSLLTDRSRTIQPVWCYKFLQCQNKVLVPCRGNRTFCFVVVSVLAANYEPKIAQYQQFVYYGSETRGCEGNRKTTVEPLSCFAAVPRYFFGVLKHILNKLFRLRGLRLQIADFELHRGAPVPINPKNKGLL